MLRRIVLALVFTAAPVAAATAAHADTTEPPTSVVTKTPTIVVYTDANGNPVSTATVMPTDPQTGPAQGGAVEGQQQATVVIRTDSNGKPVATETIMPQQGQAQQTVTVTPPSPGVRQPGVNDAGQWVGGAGGFTLGVFGLLWWQRVTGRRPVRDSDSGEIADAEADPAVEDEVAAPPE